MLRYLQDEESLAYELVCKHVYEGNGLNLDGNHVTANKLAAIIRPYEDVDEEESSPPETEE